MFADDTEFHFCHGDLSIVECTLQADLENISVRLMVNRLKLNVSKSHCMLIGSRQRTGGKCLHLRLNGDVLRQLSSIKYLGVHIDQHLTWSTHIDSVLNKVRGKLYCINRLRPISCKVLRLLYVSSLYLTDYCDIV